MQSKDKGIFRNKFPNTTIKETPHLTRIYLEFCFTHSLDQIIKRSTRVTDHTTTLIDHILTRKPGIDLLYCTRKISLSKTHKHNLIFVHLMKRYSAERFFEIPRKMVFPNYLTCTCVNDSYFIYWFGKAIKFIALAKWIKVMATFDNQIMSETIGSTPKIVQTIWSWNW